MDKLRKEALKLFDVAVKAADPAVAVSQALAQRPLEITNGRLVIVALGKAAGAMYRAAFSTVSSPTKVWGLVITNAENATHIEGAEVIAGGHPEPNENSALSGQRLKEILSDLDGSDQVLMLVSGGGSALMTAPVKGVSNIDKAALNNVLLGSGLNINEMNLVRQNLSDLKGGGVLRLAQPAKLRALILSDVIGDDLHVVASGPTVGRVGNRSDAVKVLRDCSAFEKLPKSVQRVLLSRDEPLETQVGDNQIVGSNRVSLKAMLQAHQGAIIVDDALTGDVGKAAEKIVKAAQSHAGPVALIFGGETTVKIKGTGLGGRNQELALRVAMAAKKLGENWVFLSGGTDGRDGPTDAAGGVVDQGTISRMCAAGLDPQEILANNDSYHGLKAAGDLLQIPATGTNVADVQVFMRSQ